MKHSSSHPDGRLRTLTHPGSPFRQAGMGVDELAVSYLLELAGSLGVDGKELVEAPVAAAGFHPDAPPALVRIATKRFGVVHTVHFQRYAFGAAIRGEAYTVWIRAGEDGPGAVGVSGFAPQRAALEGIRELLSEGTAGEDPAKLLSLAAGPALEKWLNGAGVRSATAVLARPSRTRGAPPEARRRNPWRLLPPLPPELRKAALVPAWELTLDLPDAPDSVRVTVSVAPPAVLSLELSHAHATISLSTWDWDPVSRGAVASLARTAADSVLESYNTSTSYTVPDATVPLTDARVQCTTTPSTFALVVPTGPNFGPKLRDYAGGHIGAFHHVQAAFALIERLGFTLDSYFPYQGWPLLLVPSTSANAQVSLSATTGATFMIGFGMLQGSSAGGGAGAGLSFAVDRRLVFHEVFGHMVLGSHLLSPGLAFAHSFGDAFAAIFGDVEFPERTNFATFPFSAPTAASYAALYRSHGRTVASGYGWRNDAPSATYDDEQRLAATLFLLYRAIGGDSTLLTTRQAAADQVGWLVLQATAGMSAGAGPTSVEAFCDLLIAADATGAGVPGWSPGAYGKVIRWAFEQRGCFQATGPNSATTVGSPPAVDVYVDDARGGHYDYRSDADGTVGIWNRRVADGLTSAQLPMKEATNYVYVRVKNRGTTTATGATVRLWTRKGSAWANWPGDWKPAGSVVGTTQTGLSLTVGSLAPGASTVVGPFAWRHEDWSQGAFLADVSHPSDLGNIDDFSISSPIEVRRLVANDNNTAARGWLNLKKFFDFNIKNRWLSLLPILLAARAEGWGLSAMANGSALAPDALAGFGLPLSVPPTGSEADLELEARLVEALLDPAREPQLFLTASLGCGITIDLGAGDPEAGTPE